MNKFVTFFTVLAGWFRIVLFPLLICFILSLIIYLTMPGLIGVLLCMVVCFCGLVTGIIMATRILKKRGIAAFLPQPEEEETPEEEKNTGTP